MRARVPLMVGDAPLLAAGIGAAGLSLALTAPGEAWFTALDTLMETGAERARAEAACADQSALLRPSAAQAARRWYETLQEYRARCLGFSAGRV
ncbi:hypothetical protein VZ95_15620 [Elstera litoralis]|uniref:Uncharacterized protein n=2 Tax=Elstera litoralis TaxID=552518 RepID=A0A0F3IPW2_9PROT|nr:hypothetical protein VZ95_15620 [Elstera litoralis]